MKHLTMKDGELFLDGEKVENLKSYRISSSASIKGKGVVLLVLLLQVQSPDSRHSERQSDSLMTMALRASLISEDVTGRRKPMLTWQCARLPEVWRMKYRLQDVKTWE